MISLVGKTVLVTGGSSMIGRQVIKKLNERGAAHVLSPTHNEVDLLNLFELEGYFYDLRVCGQHHKIDYIVHLATYSGNIQFNKNFPADIYFRTSQMALNILDFAHREEVEKVVSVLPSCAYSAFDKDGHTKEVLFEKEFDDGHSHPSVDCHGHAKRVLFDLSRMMHKQHGHNYVCCVLNNSMGEFDSFDIDKTKVIGGMIKKFVEAKRANFPYVECWGTGAPRREFIHCEDAAEGIIRTLEMYDDPQEVINIGGVAEISIKALAELIASLCNYQGKIVWLTDKGDGQMRKRLNNRKMLDILKWQPQISLEEGIVRAIRYYEDNFQ